MYVEEAIDRAIPVTLEHKTMVVIIAPDDAIMRFVLNGDVDAVARYLVIAVEEIIPTLSEAEEICRRTFCKDAEDEDELLYCVQEICVPRVPELQTPRVVEIHASIYGRYVRGCEAFALVKDWLPAKEYHQLSERCGA